jgi:membrane-bound lytic murein transglycosylase A
MFVTKFEVLVCFFLFVGCARAPIKDPVQALRLSSAPEILGDDAGFSNLYSALKSDIEKLKTLNGSGVLVFGPESISRADYVAGLEELSSTLEKDPGGELFLKTVKENFHFYEVYGNDKGWGDVFVTSYYEPVIQGRLKPEGTYTQPLYETPKDLLTINTSEFARIFPALKPYQEIIQEKSRDGVLRGRLDKQSVVPYYSRKEIDEEGQIKKNANVICYVDPVDAFFLQIQGSGEVILPKGEIVHVGYSEQNGHPYSAIGKLLFDKIPKEKMTAQKIVQYLHSLSKVESQKILSTNASFVFFKNTGSEPLTSFGAVAEPGRTIATDPKYFPKGTLAFLEYERPKFKDGAADSASTDDDVLEFTKTARFVLDQDVGGAIRGPGRVDLFWGRGDEAQRVSGVMRNPGRLYYILPNKRAL